MSSDDEEGVYYKGSRYEDMPKCPRPGYTNTSFRRSGNRLPDRLPGCLGRVTDERESLKPNTPRSRSTDFMENEGRILPARYELLREARVRQEMSPLRFKDFEERQHRSALRKLKKTNKIAVPVEPTKSERKQRLAKTKVAEEPDEDQNLSKCRLAQAAIDFGTTYSGYTFSLLHEYKRDPLKMHTNEWQNVDQSQMHAKIPTCLLLCPDTSLHSFGYEAKEAYGELTLDEKHREHYFFWNFKMSLHQEKEIKDNMQLTDETGKKLDAIIVFTESIRFFKEHLLKILNNSMPGFLDDDIGWVITVPAIWNESAKKFMRLAAEKAGIPKRNIEIGLEPETASLFCRLLPVTKDAGTFSVGTKYMIVDCGGGTVDITVHEILENNRLRELHKATGGDWGGNQVNKRFLQYMSDLVGEDNFKTYREENKAHFLELVDEFEKKKRTYDPIKMSVVSIRLPSSFRDLLKERLASTDSLAVHLVGDKLRMESAKMVSFFNDATQNIIAYVQDVLESLPLQLNALLMVGGFSDSNILKQAIKNEFGQRLNVLIPPDGSLCVSKGAVLYAYQPSVITERKVRYTFGLAQIVPFVKGEHPLSKLVRIDGRNMCNDVFDVHVKIGETVKYGSYQQEKIYYPTSSTDTVYSVVLFRSTQQTPKFVDDEGCEAVGYFLAKRPFPKGTSTKNEEIKVRLAFGHSDVRAKIIAKDGSVMTHEFKF